MPCVSDDSFGFYSVEIIVGTLWQQMYIKFHASFEISVIKVLIYFYFITKMNVEF